MEFVGRDTQIAWLNERLREVRRTGQGQMLSVRGRRQVGKSRLIEEFIDRSGEKAVYYTATQQPAPAELELFREAIASSSADTATLASAGPVGGWDAALTLLAAEATTTRPVIVVIDELPYLAVSEPAIEATLQASWRRLEREPLLVILVGSDLSMMEALNTYGRPLYGRLRELLVPPFSPAETADRLGLDPAAALDAQVVLGGMPRLAVLWEDDDDLWRFLERQLEDATSPLLVLGERSVNAELPADLKTRAVLAAIGAGERAYTAIQNRAGIKQATLNLSIRTLEEKRIVAKLVPYSARGGASRNTRYVVQDPYLRFWLRFLGPGIELVERGRGDVLLERIRRDWTTFRGRAIEPIVRSSIERLLPDARFGDARFVGSFWTRDNRVEVDLVGGAAAERADPVEFLGSTKWREDEVFGRDAVAALVAHRAEIPGAGEQSLLVGVSRSGFDTRDLDVALGPAELVDAWR
jgi:AAA+ ATPase superfamily predicted ATPase